MNHSTACHISPVTVLFRRKVPDRLQKFLPWVFALVLALSRWPDLFPPNFSAVYAVCLCSGLFIPGCFSWSLPLGALLITDVALNCWYQLGLGFDVWNLASLVWLGGNYFSYAALWCLGRGVRPIAKWHWLRRLLPTVAVSGFGALLFYLITNTLAWLLDPHYLKTFAGWWTALTLGTLGWPETWTFLRNGILSSALFSALFAATWQNSAGESPAEKGEEISESEAEEAKA